MNASLRKWTEGSLRSRTLGAESGLSDLESIPQPVSGCKYAFAVCVHAELAISPSRAHLGWVQRGGSGAEMSKPVIFTISAVWDDEASVWSGHCDDIPAAADAPTLDELLAKISAMALDLLPDNHPNVDPASLFLQITALREAEPATA